MVPEWNQLHIRDSCASHSPLISFLFATAFGSSSSPPSAGAHSNRQRYVAMCSSGALLIIRVPVRSQKNVFDCCLRALLQEDLTL